MESELYKEVVKAFEDVEPIPQMATNVKILKFTPSEEYDKVNSIFRAVLKSEEISARVLKLTSLLISVSF